MNALTKNAIFPKEILVIGSVLADTFEFVISMMICLIIASFTGIKPSISLFSLFIISVLQIMLVLGVSLFLSFAYVFIKDIGHIYRVFLRLLFFITPIFYDLSFLGEGAAKYIALSNPLTHLINFSRTIIINGEQIPFSSLFTFFILSLSFIYFSFKLFKYFEPRFAEKL
jgi:ABC-type polysaccharide/polyol phosphate export permease